MFKISEKIEVYSQENPQENLGECGYVRGIRAKCDISCGESLIREQPEAWILSACERENYCQYCFVQLDDDYIVCSNCTFARYCGKECKSLHDEIHRNECKALQRMFPLVPPNSVRLLARMMQLNNKSQAVNSTDGKTSKQVDFPSKVNDLQSNTKHLDRQQFAVGLDTFRDYLSQSEVSDIDVAMEIFGKIECNCFEVMDMEQKIIGAAIYLRTSMFNHSCEPNCVAVFDGCVVDVRTIKEITANEECIISYCELLAPRSERQKKLKDQYHFTCACRRCNADQTEEPDILSCASDHDTTRAIEDSTTVESSSQIQSRYELETQSLGMLKDVEKLSQEGKFSDGIEMCNLYITRQRRIFPKYHYITLRTLEALVDLYIELGQDLAKAAEFGDETIEAYRQHYPTNYPSIAWQLRKVALINSLLEDNPINRLQRAVKLITEAKDIFLVSHGEEHPLVDDCDCLIEDWTSTLTDLQKEDSCQRIMINGTLT